MYLEKIRERFVSEGKQLLLKERKESMRKEGTLLPEKERDMLSMTWSLNQGTSLLFTSCVRKAASDVFDG